MRGKGINYDTVFMNTVMRNAGVSTREPFDSGVVERDFDVIATDAGYRSARTADRYRDDIRALVAQGTAQGKPVAITEFGCTTHPGRSAKSWVPMSAWPGMGAAWRHARCLVQVKVTTPLGDELVLDTWIWTVGLLCVQV